MSHREVNWAAGSVTVWGSAKLPVLHLEVRWDPRVSLKGWAQATWMHILNIHYSYRCALPSFHMLILLIRWWSVGFCQGQLFSKGDFWVLLLPICLRTWSSWWDGGSCGSCQRSQHCFSSLLQLLQIQKRRLVLESQPYCMLWYSHASLTWYQHLDPGCPASRAGRNDRLAFISSPAQGILWCQLELTKTEYFLRWRPRHQRLID